MPAADRPSSPERSGLKAVGQRAGRLANAVGAPHRDALGLAHRPRQLLRVPGTALILKVRFTDPIPNPPFRSRPKPSVVAKQSSARGDFTGSAISLQCLTCDHPQCYPAPHHPSERPHTVDPDFWLTRWQNNQIGFHEGVPNSLLVAHFAALGVPDGGRVFVPLCGKSRDMPWLRAQGVTVVGAELSRLAVERFFAEAGLAPDIASAGRLERFAAAGVTVFVGDVFDLDAATLGAVDAVYDRAALVALPEPVRARYAAHLIALTGGAPQLLLTFEYDQSRQKGPPFSVAEAELRALYGAAYRLERAEARAVPGGLRGVCPAEESAWLMRRR